MLAALEAAFLMEATTLSSPMGWPGDIGQEEAFALDESTGWDEDIGAEAVIYALFGAPAMPVLIWRPDPARIERTVLFRTVITQFESGKEQRRAKGSPRRRFTIQFRKGQVDADDLWAFYQARRGAYVTFLWENPIDDQSYTVRFENDRLTRTALWKAAFESGLSLIEVW